MSNLIRIQKKHKVFIDIAYLISSLSTCERNKVGVIIITKDNSQIVGIGYNGNYAGGANDCDSILPGHCGCVHAEQNALLKFSSIMHDDAKMFTTLSPCKMCAKLIINAGIKSVYYAEEYRNIYPIDLLQENGLHVEKIS